MLTIAKLLMRGAALGIALLVLWATHVLSPNVNVLEAGGVFFVLWMCFTFAVVLLASSWVVGRASRGGFKFGKDKQPSQADIEALRKKLRAMCEMYGCNEYKEQGSRYCITHRGAQAHGGGQ
jgi:hypothetical protein